MANIIDPGEAQNVRTKRTSKKLTSSDIELALDQDNEFDENSDDEEVLDFSDEDPDL